MPDKKYYAAHKEELKKYHHEYFQKHYSEHKEEIKSKKKKYYAEHNEELNEHRRKHYATHKKQIGEYKSKQNKKERLIVLNHYGGKCAFCGDKNINHLCIDHINNDGGQHRKIVPASRLPRWLIKNNFHNGFQILCQNHNSEKQIHGIMTLAIYD